MKKLLLFVIALMMFLMTGCSKKNDEEIPGDASQICLVKVETEGIGLVAIAQEGETLKFNEEMTSSASYLNVPEGTIITIGARESVDDYKFVRWTKNGEDFSNDYEITVTIDKPTDFIAVFKQYGGWDGPAASTIEEAKTFSDILGLPFYGYSLNEDSLVYVFELNGTIYRAIADLTPEIYEPINNAFGDNQKFNELVAPLKIDLIDNVSEAIPTQKQLDRYVGKTGGELLDAGWKWNYYNLDEMEFGMEHGWFSYIVKFDGKVEYKDNLDIEAAIRDLKVLSVTYDNVSSSVTDLAE